MIIDDRESNQNGWYALQDIAVRSEAAYNKHAAFFNDPNHRALCELIAEELKREAVDYSKLYETPRDQAKNGVFTEIKIDKVQFRKGGKARVDAAAQALGIESEDIVYRPATQSMTIRVK